MFLITNSNNQQKATYTSMNKKKRGLFFNQFCIFLSSLSLIWFSPKPWDSSVSLAMPN
jgi:hypothetical protein